MDSEVSIFLCMFAIRDVSVQFGTNPYKRRQCYLKFCDFLSIYNCYFDQEKSQLDFLCHCFQRIMLEPYSDADLSLDEKDEYYPFSKLSEESTARKVYSGERTLSKQKARFVISHYDATQMINDIYDFDEGVRQNLCNELHKYGVKCNVDNVAETVSDLFYRFIVAAINEKDNIETESITKTTVEISSENASNRDMLLLLEVDNKCPLCKQKLLITKGKNKTILRYTVVQIFPESIDKELYVAFGKIAKGPIKYSDSINCIALCSECAADYMHDPCVEAYKKLYNIKQSIIKKSKIRDVNDELYLDEDIGDVISGLVSISKSDLEAGLRMDALKIEQKILPDNTLLLSAVSDDVTNYYRIIEDLFSDIDSRHTGKFDIIANEFRMAYVKLKALCLSQDAIVDALIEWLKDNTGVVNYTALHIVVSFFIQNCEVFDEISQ